MTMTMTMTRFMSGSFMSRARVEAKGGRARSTPRGRTRSSSLASQLALSIIKCGRSSLRLAERNSFCHVT